MRVDGYRMSLIKDLLGKDERITYKDIKQLVGKYVESFIPYYAIPSRFQQPLTEEPDCF